MITPEKMIDELNGVFGQHAGCRALHAKGTMCKGRFTALPEAKALTRAPHMQGDPIEATVRFSNGTGNPHVSDKERDVRGLAVKLYLADGSRTDLVAQTASRSPTRTPDEFIALVEAVEIKPINAVRLPLYLVRHPGAVKALGALAGEMAPPPSYATARYYPLHAYRWIDAEGGERFVRYTFVPEAGREKAAGKDVARGRDFLQEELRERLSAGPIRFALEVQIAGPQDDPDDVTDVWNQDGDRVTVGTLEVTGLETGRETGGDVVVFDPQPRHGRHRAHRRPDPSIPLAGLFGVGRAPQRDRAAGGLHLILT